MYWEYDTVEIKYVVVENTMPALENVTFVDDTLANHEGHKISTWLPKGEKHDWYSHQVSLGVYANNETGELCTSISNVPTHFHRVGYVVINRNEAYKTYTSIEEIWDALVKDVAKMSDIWLTEDVFG